MNLKSVAASVAAASLLAPTGSDATSVSGARLFPAGAAAAQTTQSAAIAQRNALIAALRKRVNYVFVLYQENRSFDSYFGTFPGADGIYSRPAAQTPGFSQKIENTDGTFTTISPFRIGPQQYAADTDDIDHSHPRMVAKIDVTTSGPQMDQFAYVEELKRFTPPALPSLQAKQYAELAMAHEDCDTIPLLWNYASRFALADHIFSSYLTPSTPGNIAIFSAQAGETQSVLHPTEAYKDNGNIAAGLPVMNDRDPDWGPYNPVDGATPASVQLNLTFATLPLTLAGPDIPWIFNSDPTKTSDFADVLDDVRYVAGQTAKASWGWFQEGYDQEPGTASPLASLANYVTHHNGPQYFGYLANSSERKNLHGLGDFMAAVTNGTLPSPGVFYVKGGFQNFLGLKPADPDAAVQKNFNGDDDHPGYSDAQISEALVAANINRIVKSRYWSQSAIIVTYDDAEGDYDHVPPIIKEIGPGVGNVPADFISNGPRIPLIVISPFAKTHYISHTYGDQGSVVKFVDRVFGLTPLSDLPDELNARNIANYSGKFNYGPDDGATSGTSDLLDAFDYDRLTGRKPPVDSGYAYVNPAVINHLPRQTGIGCRWAGIVPTDYLFQNNIPRDFNPRPGTDPSAPNVTSLNTRLEVIEAKDPDD